MTIPQCKCKLSLCSPINQNVFLTAFSKSAFRITLFVSPMLLFQIYFSCLVQIFEISEVFPVFVFYSCTYKFINGRNNLFPLSIIIAAVDRSVSSSSSICQVKQIGFDSMEMLHLYELFIPGPPVSKHASLIITITRISITICLGWCDATDDVLVGLRQVRQLFTFTALLTVALPIYV